VSGAPLPSGPWQPAQAARKMSFPVLRFSLLVWPKIEGAIRQIASRGFHLRGMKNYKVTMPLEIDPICSPLMGIHVEKRVHSG